MDSPDANHDPAPLSAQRLRLAFARMLGQDEEPPATTAAPDAATPEAIVEGILFVGRADGTAIPPTAIAEVIRDVTPDEVERIAERLDRQYEADSSAMTIRRIDGGLRLEVREGPDRVGDRLRSPVRSAKLSQQALETLSIVAYRQPIKASAIDELRQAASTPVLGNLERLGLVRRDAPAEAAGPCFRTTDRFLRLLRLGGIDQLPRVAELDD